MTLFGALGFTAPWLLLGLLALPVLWILLRAVPPAPVRRLFPGVVLLLGLKDEEQVSDRTPWWLLLLRMLAVAAVILGLAGPILNPEEDEAAVGDRPLLVVMDASWASAGDWRARETALDGLLCPRRPRRPPRRPHAPLRARSRHLPGRRRSGAAPAPASAPNRGSRPRSAWKTPPTLLPDGPFDTYWFSDGITREARDAASRGARRRAARSPSTRARRTSTPSPPPGSTAATSR